MAKDKENAGRSQSGGHRGLGRGPHGMRGPIEKAKQPKQTVTRLLRYLIAERLLLLLVFGLVIISSVFTLLGPYLIGVAIDQYIIPEELAGLLKICLFMVIIHLFSAVATWLQHYVMIGVAQRGVFRMRKSLFARLQTLPLSFFDKSPHGDLMSRLTNDIENVSHSLNNSVSQVFASLVMVIGTLGMMIYLNPLLTFFSLLIIPLMGLSAGKIAKATRTYFADQQEKLGALNGLIEETISGQRVVKVFCREESIIKDFHSGNAKLKEAGLRAQIFSGMIWPLMNVLNNLGFVVVAAVGGWLAVNNVVTIGVIAAFLNYSRQFTRPLSELAHQFNMIQAGIAGAERVFEIIDQQPEPADQDQAPKLENIRGQVDIEGVSFAYSEDTPILKDISLHVEAGQTIALVGPTGAGKTTIINLLTRFYDIDQGEIRIDGKDIRQVQRNSLRSLLGIVLQDTYLFSETVRENIRYGRLDATDQEVEQAAKLANADTFIERLPQGYDTVLAEDGGNLSQGQRQLLAIARAVLADPAILILDEATSSVDTRTELHIQQAMLRLMEGRTSFVIAHRLSTIQGADKIVVINGGKIIESGDHGELLAKQGFYYNLYMSQFKRAVSDPA